MNPSVRLLAEWVEGAVVGDGETRIASVRPLNEAGPGDLTFVDGERSLKAWDASPAAAAVVSQDFPQNGRPLIVVANPIQAFASIILRLRGEPSALLRDHSMIDPTARIATSARIGENPTIHCNVMIGSGTTIGNRCLIHPGVVIGKNCHIGDDVTLHPHVVLYDNTILGNRCIIHANAVIGGDGYGYQLIQGVHVKIPQVGWVEVGEDVEIGCGTTIDRGTFAATRIGDGTKIDNLVMIGHNSQIGRHNLICAQVGIAGSSVTGDYVVMAGQAGLADHVNIADRTIIAAQAGVIRNVTEPGLRIVGYPAKPDKQYWRTHFLQEKIPAILKDLKKIKEALGM